MKADWKDFAVSGLVIFLIVLVCFVADGIKGSIDQDRHSDNGRKREAR